MDGSNVAGFVEPGTRVSGALRRRQHWLRRVLIAAGGGLALAGIALYGHYYWTVGRFLVSTDDAYVQAHSVIISPQVSGYIVAVPVDDSATS